jgi:trehalose 6-phosphate phosphatase
MKHLLARRNVGVLEPIACSRVLLAFDYDGTLAPIVARHQEAKMRRRTLALLVRLCRLYPCAVISGRSRRDVSGRLGGAPIPYVIGNHGSEPGADLLAFARDVRRVDPILRRALRDFQGVEVENKRYSFAVHYRQSRTRSAAEAAILDTVAALPVKMRCIPGKMLVNVVPAAAPTKGDAVLRLRSATKTDVAFFVGDDATDEDVFMVDEPGRLVGVRVGRSQTSAATYFLRDQAEIDVLLEKLAVLRTTSAKAR